MRKSFTVYSIFSPTNTFIRAGRFITNSRCSKDAAFKGLKNNNEIRINCILPTLAEALYLVAQLTAEGKLENRCKQQIVKDVPNKQSCKIRRAKAILV